MNNGRLIARHLFGSKKDKAVYLLPISQERNIKISSIILGVIVGMITGLLTVSRADDGKIGLPDGLYMYDAPISQLEDGRESINFQKCFVVYNKNICSPQKATKTFGAKKLNRLLTKNKKYKIIHGDEQIGQVYDVRLYQDGDYTYEQSLKKSIKEGPAYMAQRVTTSWYRGAAGPMAVPEEYRQTPTTFSKALTDDEVAKISRLVENELLNQVIERKEVKQYKLEEKHFQKIRIEVLDKLSDRDEETYIGVYSIFFTRENKFGSNVGYGFEIALSATKDGMHVVTSNYEDQALYDGTIKICGMLDVDGCGKNELIIEKEFGDEDGIAASNLEIYKQKPDGDWIQITKIKTRRQL